MLKPGDSVIFNSYSKEQVNFGSCDDPIKYLKMNNVYFVEEVEVHSWHTKVTLNEVPNYQFNSTHFELVGEKAHE
jgi:hypothetical protein